MHLQVRLGDQAGHGSGGRLDGNLAGGFQIIEVPEQSNEQDYGSNAQDGQADAEEADGKHVDVLRLLRGAGRRRIVLVVIPGHVPKPPATRDREAA